MITYSQLGKNGRLGNQMFQYAALYAAGLTRGYKIGIPQGQKIEEVFKLPHADRLNDIMPKRIFKERSFLFDPNLFAIPDDCDIYGYFQSPLYFQTCRDAILKEFAWKDDVQERGQLATVRSSPTCAIHVRRDDYKNLAHVHTNLGGQYYIKGCELITKNLGAKPLFLVFSDEPDWCKKAFTGDDFHIVDIRDDAVELYMMSQCDAHIIANSSFSWWGAWLSNARPTNVVAPRQWFGPQGPPEWQTVYAQGWNLL
jgi:hypothetical protein